MDPMSATTRDVAPSDVSPPPLGASSSESSYEQISVERLGAILRITLNRPDKLNAWTQQMSGELTAAIEAANADPELAVVLVRGAGRGFCAGADIEASFAGNLATATDGSAPVQDSKTAEWVEMCRRSKPLIAAIHGACVGVGLSMILPFDHLVATTDARLSVRFVKMGLVPELSSSHFLVSRCGWGRASWLALSGEMVSGVEAGEMGLVDRVVAPEELDAVALEVAGILATNPVSAMRATKGLLTRNAVETDLGAVQRRELAALEEAYRSPEHHEAVAAFLASRRAR